MHRGAATAHGTGCRRHDAPREARSRQTRPLGEPALLRRPMRRRTPPAVFRARQAQRSTERAPLSATAVEKDAPGRARRGPRPTEGPCSRSRAQGRKRCLKTATADAPAPFARSSRGRPAAWPRQRLGAGAAPAVCPRNLRRVPGAACEVRSRPGGLPGRAVSLGTGPRGGCTGGPQRRTARGAAGMTLPGRREAGRPARWASRHS